MADNKFTSTTINSDNTEITVVFSEAVSGVSNGTGVLTGSDFTISISGGTANSPIINSVLNSSSTEKVLTISYSGAANGSETVTVLPETDAIFLAANTTALTTTQSNNTISLNDQTLPTMVISSTTSGVSDGSTTNDTTIALTFTASEATTDFDSGDITVSGGALSSFNATSSTVYTATFTPTGSGTAVQQVTTIDVAGNKFTDAVGNNNTAATQFNWTYDNVPPTMTITSTTSGVSDGSTTNDTTIALTFTSSKATTDFIVGDITVSGGDWSSFNATSSTVYTATFTPTGSGTAVQQVTTIDVAGNKFTDAVGNNNTAATQFNWTYDNAPPLVSSFTTTTATGSYKAGQAIVITANTNEAVKDTNNITVTLNNTTNTTVVLTAGADGATMVGTYTVAAGDNTASLAVSSFTIGTVTDLADNASTNTTVPTGANMFSNKTIVIDTTAPTITLNTSSLNFNIGVMQVITATSNEALYFNGSLLASDNKPATNITVTTSSSGTAANLVIVSSTSFTFEFTPAVASETLTVTVANTITDLAGNTIANTDFPITAGAATIPRASACFPSGTPINTDQGIVAIDKINIETHTIRGNKIKTITQTYLVGNKMVLFKKNSLHNNVPCMDTIMSRHHHVYYNKEMNEAYKFIKLNKAEHIEFPEDTVIYNVLLDNHEKMVINNMIVETQDPHSTTGYFYNNFILNENCSKKDIRYATELLTLFNTEKWTKASIDLNTNDLLGNSVLHIMKEGFKAYLVQHKNKNKKRVHKIMDKLIPVHK
jgi:hypothetical protein